MAATVAPTEFDSSQLLPVPGPQEKAVAITRLVLASFYFVVGFGFFLPWLFKERKSLDVRLRSPYLLLASGSTALLVTLMLALSNSIYILHPDQKEWPKSDYAQSFIFFSLPMFYFMYVFRAVRLLVMARPKLRKRVPSFVVNELYIVAFSLVVALVCFFPVPVAYQHDKYSNLQSTPWKVIEYSLYAVCALLVLLFPFVFQVKDLWSLNQEIMIVSTAFFALTFLNRLVTENAEAAFKRFDFESMWIKIFKWLISRHDLTNFVALLVFTVSNVWPVISIIRRRKQQEDRRQRAGRRQKRFIKSKLSAQADHQQGMDGGAHTAEEDMGRCDSMDGATDYDENTEVDDNEAEFQQDLSRYGRLADISAEPAIEDAFLRFVRSALCEESFLFLKAVDAYKAHSPQDPHSPVPNSPASSIVGHSAEAAQAATRSATKARHSPLTRLASGYGSSPRLPGVVARLARSVSSPPQSSRGGTSTRGTPAAGTPRSGTAAAGGGGDDAGATPSSPQMPSALASALAAEEEGRLQSHTFQAFKRLCDAYIEEGSLYEVNISSRLKKSVLGYSKDPTLFQALSVAERRNVFDPCYSAIKSMLEMNLVIRFLTSKEFAAGKAEIHETREEREQQRLVQEELVAVRVELDDVKRQRKFLEGRAELEDEGEEEGFEAKEGGAEQDEEQGGGGGTLADDAEGRMPRGGPRGDDGTSISTGSASTNVVSAMVTSATPAATATAQ